MDGRSFRVRPARLDDVDAILLVLDEGRHAIARLGIDQWQDGYPERLLIEQDVARGISYVAEASDGGPLIGAAAIDFAGEPTYDVIDGAWLTAGSSATPPYGVIHRITTAEAARGRGVARALVEEAGRLAEQCGAVSLRIDTHPGNIPMQRFIEACGFRYCGVILLDEDRETTKERLAYERIL